VQDRLACKPDAECSEAWNDEESRGLGIPFPPVAERFERLEETLLPDRIPQASPRLHGGITAEGILDTWNRSFLRSCIQVD
jgi:hypothetical protein